MPNANVNLPLNVDLMTSSVLQNGVPVGNVTSNPARQQAGGWNITAPTTCDGLYGRLSSVGGSVTVAGYADAAMTRELFNVVFTFTASVHGSVQFAAPIDAPDGVWWQVTGDATSAGKTIRVRPALTRQTLGSPV
jgi:hypothetical protein